MLYAHHQDRRQTFASLTVCDAKTTFAVFAVNKVTSRLAQLKWRDYYVVCCGLQLFMAPQAEPGIYHLSLASIFCNKT